ncbi:MAG TPA: putative PEP-binding protein, partial [Acidothermales bacterium]
AAAAGVPARTRDDVHILVGANVGSVDEAATAARLGADLAGLVRTEFLFHDRADPPDVEEQEAAYRDVAAAFGGRRVILRTLDVGGDKPLAYISMAAEANPFLGVRGLRLSLTEPKLLADQLRAIVRTAHDWPISVMFPMVSTLDELMSARRLLDEAGRDEGGLPSDLQVGIMVETPATALKAAAFAPHVDFFSIGTNDLTQYALAAERGNAAVSSVGDAYDPGLLRLIEATCAGAGDSIPAAVCGELAADAAAVPLLIGLGVHELSVVPHAIPSIKQAIREVDSGEARELAQAALRTDSADDVRALLAASSTNRR